MQGQLDVIELLFSTKMEDKTRGHCFEALRHTSKRHIQFFLRVLRIGSLIGSAL